MSDWVKACSAHACVEVRRISDDVAEVRDSTDSDPERYLLFNREEWDAFIDGAKHGLFDWENLPA